MLENGVHYPVSGNAPNLRGRIGGRTLHDCSAGFQQIGTMRHHDERGPMPEGARSVVSRTAHWFRTVPLLAAPLQLKALFGSIALLLATSNLTVRADEIQMPFAAGEDLAYAITWPSGLSVGSARFRARPKGDGWRFEMTVEASVHEFAVDDAFVSETDANLCSSKFEKHVRHGARRAHEALRFADGTVERTNLDPVRPGPPGTASVGACARDALAAVYYLRQDLAAGRLPAPGTVHFGAAYDLRLEYEQTRWLPWDEGRRRADLIRVKVRGPASRLEFLAYFGRDAARTPLLFQARIDGESFVMRLVE